MLGPFATASRFALPFTRCRYCRKHAACASMSTTTTTTTTRDRGDRYGPRNEPKKGRRGDGRGGWEREIERKGWKSEGWKESEKKRKGGGDALQCVCVLLCAI